MIRRPPRSTRTDTLFPYTTLFRSAGKRIRGIEYRRHGVSFTQRSQQVRAREQHFELDTTAVKGARRIHRNLCPFQCCEGYGSDHLLLRPRIDAVAIGLRDRPKARNLSLRQEERRVGKESVSTYTS